MSTYKYSQTDKLKYHENAERQTNRHTDRQKYLENGSSKNARTYKYIHTDKQTHRQIDRQTDRQTKIP